MLQHSRLNPELRDPEDAENSGASYVYVYRYQHPPTTL